MKARKITPRNLTKFLYRTGANMVWKISGKKFHFTTLTDNISFWKQSFHTPDYEIALRKSNWKEIDENKIEKLRVKFTQKVAFNDPFAESLYSWDDLNQN